MKTRRLFRKFILVLLMIAIALPLVQSTTVYSKRKAYSDGHPSDLEHPYGWVDYSDGKVEEQILAEQKERGSQNDYEVNYYTIREMVLNDKYDPEILSKKYRMLDEYLRYSDQFSNDRPFYNEVNEQFVEKVGIIDRIWELESGAVVFTLTDNPTKRFFILPVYDYFHFRYLTQPGDKVGLITTVDRVVYEFDNYDLSRGQQVNYAGYMNYNHPEDMISDGFFPSELYKERIQKANIHIEDWLKLMLEYVDVECEEYFGYAAHYMMSRHINPESILSVSETLEMHEAIDAICEDIKEQNRFYANQRARDNAYGFDYDDINELLDFTYGEIREIKTNDNGETVFTLWEEPTRWYYISKYYDPLRLANITKPGDDVYIIHTYGKIVYGFNNLTIFDTALPINTPYYVKKLQSMAAVVSGKEFWNRVKGLPARSRQKYEKFDIPKE